MNRVKLISMSILAIFMVIFLTGIYAGPASAASEVMFNVTVQEDYSSASELLKLVNSMRGDYGLTKIKMDDRLQDLAMQRATELILCDGHIRPNGSLISEECASANYEVVDCGSSSTEKVLTKFRSNSGDLSVLRNKNGIYCGIGAVKYENTYYWAILVSKEQVSSVSSMSGIIKKTRIVHSDASGLSFRIALWNQNGVGSYTGNSIYYGKDAEAEVFVRSEQTSYASRGIRMNTTLLNFKNNSPAVLSVTSKGVFTPIKTGTGTVTISMLGAYPLYTTVNVEVVSNTRFRTPDMKLPEGNKYRYDEQKEMEDQVKPKVSITDVFGIQLKEGTDYRMEYIYPTNGSWKCYARAYFLGNYADTYGEKYVEKDFYYYQTIEPETPPQTDIGDPPVLFEDPAVISLNKTSYNIGEEVIVYIDGCNNVPDSSETSIEFDIPASLTFKGFAELPRFKSYYDDSDDDVLYTIQYKNASGAWHDYMYESAQNTWSMAQNIPANTDIKGLRIYSDHKYDSFTQKQRAAIKFSASKGYNGDIILTTKETDDYDNYNKTQTTAAHLLIIGDGISGGSGIGGETLPGNKDTSINQSAVSGNSNTANNANKVTKPKKTSITGLGSGRKQLTARWKKIKGISGYQVQCATNKKFTKNKKTKTVSGYKKTKVTIKKLKTKKTYYVRIRTFKKVNGTKVYSNWSKAKKIKTK